MKPKAPSELIKKFLKGEASQEEVEKLYQWYDSFEQLADPTSQISEKEKVHLKKRMFENIVEKSELLSEDTSVNKSKVVPFYLLLASVAAMFFLACSIVLYFQNSSAPGNDTVISSYISVKNTSSSLTKHVFPDGTIAWMRPSAHLEYRKDFNNGPTRDVTMQGEAFFEVTKNPKRPFIIKTGEVYTKVLGTSFNVKSYPGMKQTEVSVVTGKVMVYTLSSSPGKVKQEAFLLPKEKIIASVAEVKFEKRAETSVSMNIWQKESLSFNNTPVGEVVKALNKKFASNIQIKDPIINQYQLNADFTNVNLPSVLELLSKSLGITYEINESGITMSKPNEN
ncbi:FecR family protein [Desertivirga arenae]|uniref:FecR family protein n=1 Tax=Desertivirga arenae TaxID=2810309 RepID=UPI001A956669|nr:FecR family protein [Pedobacter sp. SYSU D00823]